MRLRWPASTLATSLAACACGASPAPASEMPHTESSSAASPSADYEVHEWGLVRGEPGDTLRYGVLAPPIDVSAMSVDKPLLYFHARAPLTLASVRVEARSGGTLLETWPLTALGTDATWRDVHIVPGETCAPSPLPTRSDPPCAALAPSDACETPTLASARTADAACVHVGDATESFLFYRGRATTFTPPLRFERTGAYEVVRVTNEGDAIIPGMLVRLWSDGMRVRTLAVAPPAPHQSIDVRADFDGESADRGGRIDEADMPARAPGPGRDALAESMRTIGLTEPEIDAFFAAWASALFGPGQPRIDALSADLDPAPRESFVYFLPDASLENVAHLALDPPPAGGVHRAIAMWSALRASGASH